MNKLKPFVILKVIIGPDNSVNLKNEDVKYLKDRFDKEKIEMIVTTERVDEYQVRRLTEKELVDFVDSVIKNKRDNEEKMKMQVDLELHDQTRYMN